MRRILILLGCALFLTHAASVDAEDVEITVDASQAIHAISPWLTGACIEDVNHEIYGGLYSQMVFGESFQEPPMISPIEGFSVYDGEWKVKSGELHISSGQGNKLVANSPMMHSGEASVDVKFDDRAPGNAGLILQVSKAKKGANDFFGYEISLDPSLQIVRLGRHRNNWEHIRDVPCRVEIGSWINLKVALNDGAIDIFVDGVKQFSYVDDDNESLQEGRVGLRQWERVASFRNLKVKSSSQTSDLPFIQAASQDGHGVSGMWEAVRQGSAIGEYRMVERDPFVGNQAQRIRFANGEGTVGINNKGLNRSGMNFQKNKEYEGVLYARADSPCEVWMVAENGDGTQVLAEKKLQIASAQWTRLEFSLNPNESVVDGRFALKLKAPGAVDVGYVFLQPGSWGRFNDLPVRRDVAEMLQAQGITILRYGGSMINNDQYRWKNMIGMRETRPPYRGHWYKHSTNGWGIVDFMNFCEAAKFAFVPTFAMHESPQDMADFIRYATEDANSEWGQKRSRDGHPQPYQLKFLQLGNEERVDEAYADRFALLADAIWSVDRDIQLIVGDFVYEDLIEDPQRVTGSASGITNLDGQRKLLRFAKQRDQEIWFDVHVWTGGPRPNRSFDAMFTFIDALESLAEGAKFKVLTFEFNANNHDQRRALANALAINAIERDGRLPIATSANCLQPDGQNDNGWDQGLVFLSPSKVWMQPPGYVTQMYSKHYASTLVECSISDGDTDLDCNAKLSHDRKTLVLNVVNVSDRPKSASINIAGFQPSSDAATVIELAGELGAANTESNTMNISPQKKLWDHRLTNGRANLSFAPQSVTTVVLN